MLLLTLNISFAISLLYIYNTSESPISEPLHPSFPPSLISSILMLKSQRQTLTVLFETLSHVAKTAVDFSIWLT